MLKKFLITLVCLSIPFSVVGCQKGSSGSGVAIWPKEGAVVPETDQLKPPAKGETIAVMKTSMGDLKIKFFPREAPKAVENFVTHAQDGYYDGLIFHRVINDFMIQGGDPTGTGTGGESIWKQPFADEFSEKVHNFRGALSMANSGSNTNGSQFFIVQAPVSTINSEVINLMTENRINKTAIAKYKEIGGTPWLDKAHTVFGQVYEGMDIVDKIAAVEVDAKSKPTKDVKIVDIKITTAP
ncbi:peptidylprolyl isomerase [Acetivibrio cellulolyticus]|uniref:peptidylprolyl isomerase n=1 Tax=Acetivibrio cellulolyticus TaxID=35830 RepID=UPI0001E2D440|nr:peptidylprolyl isomerase [Acetivibrio cellulolyticus]